MSKLALIRLCSQLPSFSLFTWSCCSPEQLPQCSCQYHVHRLSQLLVLLYHYKDPESWANSTQVKLLRSLSIPLGSAEVTYPILKAILKDAGNKNSHKKYSCNSSTRYSNTLKKNKIMKKSHLNSTLCSAITELLYSSPINSLNI